MTPHRPNRNHSTHTVPVTVVHACLRDGAGGSPTAVVADSNTFDDAARRRIPGLSGASHAVFVDARPDGSETSVRFFTAHGELPACGHGTVAALAYLADRASKRATDVEQRVRLRAAVTGHRIHGVVARQGCLLTAEFETPPVALREPTSAELALLLPSLGLPPVRAAAVATLGRDRLLVQAPSQAVLRDLSPDLPTVDDACRGLDLLGCYVYAAPAAPGGRFAARMFAPAIGVPEDIANVNSTACLANTLYATGALGGDASRLGRLSVDMGDSLHSPATITATVRTAAEGNVPLVRVGGAACLGQTLRLDLG